MLCGLLLALFSQRVELPPEIHATPGQFVTVRPTLVEGGGVEYYPLDPGLSVFPSSLLTDKSALVFTVYLPGRYRVLAYTAKADKPSPPAITTVVVGIGPGPNPNPGPGPGPGPMPGPGPGPGPDVRPDKPKPPAPPPPPPEPPADITEDPLYQAFESIAGGLQEPNQKRSLTQYGNAWTKAGPQVEGKNLGQWNSAVKKAATDEGLPLGAIAAIRERVGVEVANVVGTDPAMPLSGDKGKAAKDLGTKFGLIFLKLAENSK
jgi:hypothetical protein